MTQDALPACPSTSTLSPQRTSSNTTTKIDKKDDIEEINDKEENDITTHNQTQLTPFLLKNHQVWTKYNTIFSEWLSHSQGQISLKEFKDKFDLWITTDPNVEMGEDVYEVIMSFLSTPTVFSSYARLLNYYANRWVLLQKALVTKTLPGGDLEFNNEDGISTLNTPTLTKSLIMKLFPAITEEKLTPLLFKAIEANIGLITPPQKPQQKNTSQKSPPSHQITIPYDTITLPQLSERLPSGIIPDFGTRLSLYQTFGTRQVRPIAVIKPSTTKKSSTPSLQNKPISKTTQSKQEPRQEEYITLPIPIDDNNAYKQVETVIAGAVQHCQEAFLAKLFESTLFKQANGAITTVFATIYNYIYATPCPTVYKPIIFSNTSLSSPTSQKRTLMQLTSCDIDLVTKALGVTMKTRKEMIGESNDILNNSTIINTTNDSNFTSRTLTLWSLDLLLLWTQQSKMINLLFQPGVDSDRTLGNILQHSTTQVMKMSTISIPKVPKDAPTLNPQLLSGLNPVISPNSSSQHGQQTQQKQQGVPLPTSDVAAPNPPKQELVGVLAASLVYLARFFNLHSVSNPPQPKVELIESTNAPITNPQQKQPLNSIPINQQTPKQPQQQQQQQQSLIAQFSKGPTVTSADFQPLLEAPPTLKFKTNLIGDVPEPLKFKNNPTMTNIDSLLPGPEPLKFKNDLLSGPESLNLKSDVVLADNTTCSTMIEPNKKPTQIKNKQYLRPLISTITYITMTLLQAIKHLKLYQNDVKRYHTTLTSLSTNKFSNDPPQVNGLNEEGLEEFNNVRLPTPYVLINQLLQSSSFLTLLAPLPIVVHGFDLINSLSTGISGGSTKRESSINLNNSNTFTKTTPIDQLDFAYSKTYNTLDNSLQTLSIDELTKEELKEFKAQIGPMSLFPTHIKQLHNDIFTNQTTVWPNFE